MHNVLINCILCFNTSFLHPGKNVKNNPASISSKKTKKGSSFAILFYILVLQAWQNVVHYRGLVLQVGQNVINVGRLVIRVGQNEVYSHRLLRQAWQNKVHVRRLVLQEGQNVVNVCILILQVWQNEVHFWANKNEEIRFL